MPNAVVFFGNQNAWLEVVVGFVDNEGIVQISFFNYKYRLAIVYMSAYTFICPIPKSSFFNLFYLNIIYILYFFILIGNSYYIYTEASSRQPGVKADLLSPFLQPDTQYCLTLYYNMYGSTMGYITIYTEVFINYTFNSLIKVHKPYRRCNSQHTRLQYGKGPGGSKCQVVGLPNNSYKPITNTAWVRARLLQLTKKGAHDSQPQVIKFTSCLPMVGGSLRVLWLLPPLN